MSGLSGIYTIPARSRALDLAREAALSQTTVKVLRAAHGADDAEGRRTVTFPDVASVTAVPGRVWLRSARELRDDRWVEVSEMAARVPHDTEVGSGDRLLDVGTGLLYEVGAVTPRNHPLGVLYLEATVTRVGGGA